MFFRYVLGSLMARRFSTLIAVLSIGLVIGASVLALAFYRGLKENMAATGRRDNVVVVMAGVLQTSKSFLNREAIDKIELMPQVAQQDGQPLISPEAHLAIDMEQEAQVAPARGVEPIAFLVHDQVKIIEGRQFEKGSNEVIIGKKLVGKSTGWNLGGSVNVGGEQWPIVGVFSADASALEGELWADRSRLGIQLKSPNVLSAVVRADSQANVEPLMNAIRELRLGEGKGGAYAMNEREYYETTLGSVDAVIAAVAAIITVLMLGATFAAANTLHASLSSRMGELAALWVVGHRRGRLLRLILQEAVLICLSAAVVACALCAIFAGSEVTALLGGELEFSLPFGGYELGAAVVLALAIALLGSMYPGIQLMRRNLADDLG